MSLGQVYIFIHNTRMLLSKIDTLSATSTTDILSFVIVCILIIALFYSLITLASQNKLIAEQNQEILLKNQQLEEQNKELSQISEQKSNLIGVVSHDLKSPFNRIFALVNLLKLTGAEFSGEQKEYISKMHQVIKDGLELIRNLLDIRAIEDEGIKMIIEPIDIVKLVKDSLRNHKPLADIKEITLKLSKDVDQLFVSSDKLYVSRIVENLLSNALKFSEKETLVEVKISMKGEDYLQVMFIDQGPGISADDMKLLFRKFQILSARPTDGESSTGLGLSIVKTLVGKIEGTIVCESEFGAGTNFILTLPLLIKETA
jgi:signal transduction histidine kinase